MKISVAHLTKRYGSGEALTRVLDDVSLTLEPGEFVAIVGTSGSGKTTLLNIMGGLDTSFEGEVLLGAPPEELALGRLKDRELARLRNERFGFVFQRFHLLDHLSAEENVALPGFFARRPPPSQPPRALSLLEQMGLSHKRAARPSELSGGQRQRVAIARALYHDPDVLFCDEPTGSLDRDTGEQIMRLFADLNRERQLTLVVVTHEDHIAQMASRVIRLEDGTIRSDERAS